MKLSKLPKNRKKMKHLSLQDRNNMSIGFKIRKNAKQWIRDKDVDQAVYYPNKKKNEKNT